MANNPVREVREVDPLLGPGAVADRVGISRTQSWRLMRDGVIGPVVDVSADGGKAQLRVRVSDLDAWLAARTVRRTAS